LAALAGAVSVSGMVVRIARASLASKVDEIFGAIALGRSERSRSRSRAESLGHRERMDALERIVRDQEDARFRAPPEELFGDAGEAGAWEERRVRALRGGEVVDVRWRSGYAPISREATVLDRYRSRPENGVAHARLFLHREPRPAVLLVHGYLGGNFAVEERAWPVRWMFERLGLDLAIPVLPSHGPRNTRGRRPLFPSSDPRVNVEGFRHAIWDLMTLRRALARRGAPAVGVMGMSLGGYTSALMMTVDPDLAFGVPMIPLASIADFAREGGRLVGTSEERAAQHAAIEAAHRPVSPLARPARLAPERMRILAGEADRITPASHAKRLSEHFGARLFAFPGGHLLQFGRSEGFREVARMLGELGLLPPR
jgi:dienelactone hydrolase